MDCDFRLMLGLAAASLTLFAVVAAEIEARPAHPRLFFGPGELARLRRLGYAVPRYLAEESFSITYFGGKEVVFALPPRQPDPIENPPGFDERFGHYPYWTGMARQIQLRLEALGLSYASTGDRRYAERALDYMRALAGWQTWTDPEYGRSTCLDTGYLSMGMGFAYDACWDAMPEADRSGLREGLIRLGLAPLAQDAPARIEDSLQMLRNAALGLGGLAVVPEHAEAWDWVQLARDYFRWLLDVREASPNTEGLSYASGGLDQSLLFGAALASAEGNREIIEHPYVGQAIRWALYFWGPAASGLVNFCDAAIAHPFEVTMRVANKYLRDPYAGYYLQQSGRLGAVAGGSGPSGQASEAAGAGRHKEPDFLAAILHEPDPPVAWPPPWPASARFANIGWAALRSGWGADDTLFAFISSPSKEGHCHWDANHFVVNCAGEWLATDAGYRSFKGGALTDYGQGTAGHNSILIAGAVQRDKAGAVTDFFTSPIFDYAVGDASRAYDSQVLWRFLRRIIHVRPHFFVMLDELEAPEAKRFEFLLHSDAAGRYEIAGKPARLGKPLAAQQIAVVKSGGRLDVRFLEPVAAQAVLDYFPGTKEDYPPYITVRDSRPRESQRFLAALIASPNAAAPFTMEMEALYPQAEDPQRLVRLESLGALLFHGTGPGDGFTFDLTAPAEGTYKLTGHFLRSPACGDWQAQVDGRDAGAVFRGYARDVRTRQAWDLGEVTLARGRNEVAFCLTGKAEAASGYLAGVHSIEFVPTGAPAARARGPERFRRLIGDGWVGVACSLAAERGGREGTQCRAYFRLTGADEIFDRDFRTDAEAALLLIRGTRYEVGGTSGQAQGRRGSGARAHAPTIAAYRVTRMELGRRLLMQASAPVSFALAPGETEEAQRTSLVRLTLESDTEADVVLYLGEQPRRPNIPASLARGVRWDPTAPALRIRLRPGSHTMTWETR